MRKNAIAVVTGVSTVVLGAGWAAGLITSANNAPEALSVAGASNTSSGSSASVTGGSMDTSTTTTDSSSQATQTTDATTAEATASATSEASTTTTQAVSGGFDGAAVDTRYGPYQAEIVVEAGIITDVTILQQGDSDHETKRINERAIPTLVERVLSAQSWNVDGVSGASYTSPALLTSIKDAMSQAGLA